MFRATSYLIFTTAILQLAKAVDEIPTLALTDLPEKNEDPKWNKLMWIPSSHVKTTLHLLTPLGYQYNRGSLRQDFIPLYVAGVPYKKHIVPGKGYCYPYGSNKIAVAYDMDGSETSIYSDTSNFIVLYTPPNSVEWVNASFSESIPSNALAIGSDPKTDETTYVCRHDVDDPTYGHGKILGKVVNGVCFVPYGIERRYESYEILVTANNKCYRAQRRTAYGSASNFHPNEVLFLGFYLAIFFIFQCINVFQ